MKVAYANGGEADFATNPGGSPVVRHFLTDHLGSVRNVVDEAGAEVVSYDYTPFGRREKIYGISDYENVKGYTGHDTHQVSGLILTKYRGYDPVLGRWLSPDPIGENGGLNLYRYVKNNPFNFADPLGLIENKAPYAHVFYPGSPESADIRRVSAALNRDGHRFVFGGHSFIAGEVRDDRNSNPGTTGVSAKEIARMIVASPGYQSGMPVVMFSCQAGLSGKEINGESNFDPLAKIVATELSKLNPKGGAQSPVWGPNGKCLRHGNKNGNLEVPGKVPRGKWFLPDSDRPYGMFSDIPKTAIRIIDRIRGGGTQEL